MQYADDTTSFFILASGELKQTMLILKWFHKVSGLDINKEKTKVIKVGAMRDRSIPLGGKYAFDWTSPYEILGILYNINDMGNITDLNIKKKIGEIKTPSNIWQTCNLIPYRKTVVVKSLLLSKLTHLLLSLPSPNRHSITYPDSIVNQFMWAGKPAKIRREILEADIKFGGLRKYNLPLLFRLSN